MIVIHRIIPPHYWVSTNTSRHIGTRTTSDIRETIIPCKGNYRIRIDAFQRIQRIRAAIVERISCRDKKQGTNLLIFRCRNGIIFFFQFLLYLICQICLHAPARRISNVIDKNTETSNSQSIKMSKFIHDRIYPGIHRRFTGKTYAILHRRMSCPNKINVAGLCLSSYRSQIILSNHSLFLLCLSKRCRIISTPISQMIRICFGTINEKVHFIAFTIF